MKKFSVEFVDADGIKSVWKYDLDVTTSGPISAEQLLPNTRARALGLI